ncbi:phosphatidate cytidylyltransferase [Candidatus Sumerlaeota bacterium]|nr:phosphatidate cytidylyltransferase [Candidatus Sumerlaeota bacterium]
MWLKRIGTGLAFFLVFLASVHLWWLSWLMPMIIIMAGLLGIVEFHSLAQKKKIATPLFLSFIIASFIFADAYWGNLKHLLPVMSLSLCLVLLYFALFSEVRDSILRASVALLAPIYVALPLGIALFLLSSTALPQGTGLSILVFIVVVTWSTDTGAYFVGKNLGKHKLAPILSPNKTVEGSVGGLIVGIISAFLLFLFWKSLRLSIMWYDSLVLGVLIGVFGQIGDLAESAFKRDANTKDSGNTIIGHGGILDVIDSLLFTIPASYLYLRLLGKVLQP